MTSGDTVDHTSDYNFAIGGPIRQDKLWYFTTVRRIATNEVVAQELLPGRPAGHRGSVDLQHPRPADVPGDAARPRSPATSTATRSSRATRWARSPILTRRRARREWKNALYYTAQVKATSTISSRLLVEGGYSSNVEYFTGKYQPGVEKGRGSAEWFTQTGHEELDDVWHAPDRLPVLERPEHAVQRHRPAQARAVRRRCRT